ncbi:uracil-DNA glycosylase [Sphingomonas sp. CJ99]
MGLDFDHRWTDAAASALEWWEDAGVDQLVDELPGGWLAVPEALALAAVPAPAPPPADDSPLPLSSDAFLAWRIGRYAPDGDWPGAAVPPSGPIAAPWLILSDHPEPDDISGPFTGERTARLMDAILAAMGLTRAEVHLATVAVRTPITGQIAPPMLDALGRVARHHLQISGASRVLLLGQTTSRAIFGTSEAADRGRLRALNHDGRTVAAVATHAPRFMIQRPRAKADAWRDIQILLRGGG